jgi:hypothetical protein
MKVAFAFVFVFAVAVLTSACDIGAEDKEGPIRTRNGGGGSERPVDELSRPVLLIFAGWADLYEIVEAALSKPRSYGCIERRENEIRLNCTGTPGRVGTLTVDKLNGGGYRVYTPDREPLDSWVKGRTRRQAAEQYVDLTLQKKSENEYRIENFDSSVAFTAKAGKREVSVEFHWREMKGDYARGGGGNDEGEDENENESEDDSEKILKNLSGRLEVTLEAGARARSQAYTIDAAKAVKWKSCGVIAGAFDYMNKNSKEEMISDGRGIKKVKGGSRGLRWPVCNPNSQSLYGLAMTAPFWERPF